MSIKNNQLDKPFTQEDKDKLDSIEANAEPNPPFASQEVAEAGLDNAQIMTALRVKQAIDTFAGSSTGFNLFEKEFYNNSGSTITALTPVRQNTVGDLRLIDVGEETESMSIVGITKAEISNGFSGLVALGGLIENVSTSFEVGDLLYVSASGGLTSEAPEIGLNGFQAGDFVIYVGSVQRNQLEEEQKDIFVQVQVRGQL